MNPFDVLDVLCDRPKATGVAQQPSGPAYLKRRAHPPEEQCLVAKLKGAGPKSRPNLEEQREIWQLSFS